MTAPAFPHHKEPFSLQVLRSQHLFPGKSVMQGYRHAKRFSGQFYTVTLTQFKHSIIKDSSDHVYILSQICKDLSGILRGILKGNQFKLDLGILLLDPGPKFHKYLRWCHGGNPHPDHIIFIIPGFPRSLYGFLAVIYHIFGILIK